MIAEFEDHCWKDIIPREILDVYRQYERKVFVGPAPALLAYELAYGGGAKPPVELQTTYPSSCGEYAHAAIEPTTRLFAAARAARIPIFYSTADTRPASIPGSVTPTGRPGYPTDAVSYTIHPEFRPRAGDVVITKQRASAFYGTALLAHMTQLGIRTAIVCGESTSGCVRATAVDAYSNGFHVVLAEECCFDRSIISHKVNLFDFHHKYADVLHVEEIVNHLDRLSLRKAS